MKKILSILIVIIALISGIVIGLVTGYDKGAQDTMDSAVLIEYSKYHYAIGYHGMEYEYYYAY